MPNPTLWTLSAVGSAERQAYDAAAMGNPNLMILPRVHIVLRIALCDFMAAVASEALKAG